MHDALFAHSCRPDRAVCLCLPLRPYSLGHQIHLQQSENPLLTLSRDEFDQLPEAQQRAALVEAVDICSQTWVEYAESAALLAAAPRWRDFTLRRRQKRLRAIWRRWRAALKKLDAVDWALALADFRAYLCAGTSCLPSLSSDDPDDVLALAITGDGAKLEGGRYLGSPPLAHLLTFALKSDLARHLGLASVFDVPFSLCANLHLTAQETSGNCYIRNEREQKVRDEMVEHRRAIREEEEAEKAAQCQR